MYMEIIKIIIEGVLGTILLLALLVLMMAIPEFLEWLSDQIGFITTMGIIVGIIYIIATSNNK